MLENTTAFEFGEGFYILFPEGFLTSSETENFKKSSGTAYRYFDIVRTLYDMKGDFPAVPVDIGNIAALTGNPPMVTANAVYTAAQYGSVTLVDSATFWGVMNTAFYAKTIEEKAIKAKSGGIYVVENGNVTRKTKAAKPKKEVVLYPRSPKFPLKDGDTYEVPQDLYDAMRAAHPSVNIDQEMAKANNWLLTKPEKLRKTRSGMPKFLSGWMNRADNGWDAKNPSFVSAKPAETGKRKLVSAKDMHY